MSKRSLLCARRATLLLLSLLTAACVVGAPPGFSDGDNWTVPLVAPLENDLLLVPVSIDGEGPFLFMVDPDSPTSAVESSLQASLKLYASRGAREVQSEEDHLVRVVKAEVKKMTIGTLQVRNMKVRVFDDGTFWSGGRRVRGILGHDIISDSLVYSFDRDRGIMHIATQGHMKAPEDATALSFTQNYSNHRRYLATFKINRKHKVSMHLDLGARTSLMWPALLKKYKMPTLPVQAELVDEYGSTRTVNSGSMAGILGTKKMEANTVMMLPYGDKRMEPEDLDGVIGQNFWSRYNVTVNWHQKKFWMQPRAELLAHAKERVGRWGDQLTGCANLACVNPQISGRAVPEPAVVEPAVEPAAPEEAGPATEGAEPATEEPATEGAEPVTEEPAAPPEAVAAPPVQTGPVGLMIERESPGTDFAYDVVIGAVDEEGMLLDLPIFLASFRAGVNALVVPQLSDGYKSAAKFVVLDMNPIGTRGCEGSQCVFPLSSPMRQR